MTYVRTRPATVQTHHRRAPRNNARAHDNGEAIAAELWARYLDHLDLPADVREAVNAERLLPVEETYSLFIAARINGLDSLR